MSSSCIRDWSPYVYSPWSEPLRVGTNEYQPIELERRSEIVLEFAKPEYVNAFLEQVNIGNYTPQRKFNSAYMYVDQKYANA